ncbi:glycosyltransferase family 1 protein [Branchiibius sp. NY16-3462-2]|uniref:glycosyltransferase family 4 protein n=1 Tax=Branchiibius sp. NY16-3462-2 TaxID=1807500 RepID=UPI0007957971|nr:glycosyltransferase family 1 protein [Branchiibius sp. NY16-3462-2]KYH44973.1 hypothetical protein AZH51_13830 [Branchiibius sp. NY16-3462-2]
MGDAVTAPVVVNGAFRSQRVTGQQRYAREIADRLTTLGAFREVVPTGRWASSASREWLWTLTQLPRVSGSGMVSLTSRAPVSKRQVLTVHDLFVLTNPEWYSRGYVATHAPVLRAQLGTASAVVAVSDPIARDVQARFGGEIAVAPNAPSEVFTARPQDDLEAAVATLGLQVDSFLLCVGSLEPRKNLSRIVQAYAALPASARSRYPLVLAGGSADIYRSADLPSVDGVVTTGYVSDDVLRMLYRASTAVVFASLAEGFGLPLVEAAAAGARHLVISDLPVFRWICGDGAWYVNPVQEAAITEGLRAAIDGRVPTLTVDLQRFTWEQSAATVAQLATRCVGEKGT